MKNLFPGRIVSLAAALVFAGCSAESRKAALLERANGYYKSTEYEKARIEYQNVLQQDPDNLTAIEHMAFIWIEQGAPLRALPYLIRMKAAAPGNLELRIKLAQVMLSLGKLADARKEAVLVLARSPDNSDAIVLLTEAVRNQEDHKVAEQALLKINKNTVSYHIASANLMLLRGDTASARAALQRANSLEPKSPAAHSAMAGFHASQHNPTQAVVEFKTAAELSPIRSFARVKYAGFIAQTGAVSEAVAYLTDMTRQAPDYLPTWRTLAQIALLQKKYDESLALLQKLFDRDPQDYEGQLLRARIWLAQGDIKRSIEELERVVRDFPPFGIGMYHLALAHLQNRDEGKAMGALQAAISLNPDHVEAVLMLAIFNLRAGSAEPVASAMAELVAKRPNVMQAYPLLIEALRSQGRLDEAARAIGQNAKLAPQNGQLHYLLGLIFSALQKPTEARQSFAKAVELVPASLPATTELVNLDLKERKYADAVLHARALVARVPEIAAATFLEARAHAAQGQWDEVEASIIKTIELDGNYPGAYGLLADAFTARKHRPDLIAHLESLLAKRPNDELAIVVVGQVYIQLNKLTNARDTYEKHLSVKPDSSLVLNNLAFLYDEQLAQPEKALAAARRARSLQPGSPVIADTLGWILYKQKDYQEAWTLLQESAGKLPQNPEVQFHFGMASRMLNKHEPALAAFRIAANGQANFPGKDEAKRQLAELEAGVPAPTVSLEGKKTK
jgi:tetratricopeptide (TPR) repeat protein